MAMKYRFKSQFVLNILGLILKYQTTLSFSEKEAGYSWSVSSDIRADFHVDPVYGLLLLETQPVIKIEMIENIRNFFI